MDLPRLDNPAASAGSSQLLADDGPSATKQVSETGMRIPVLIRFATFLPDLSITFSLEQAQDLSVAGLTTLIRMNLPSSDKHSILKLIYGGRVLRNGHAQIWDALEVGKRLTLGHVANEDTELGSSKGKQPAADQLPPIYIHCSIAATARRASTTHQAVQTTPPTSPTALTSPVSPAASAEPRGFDTLLHNSGLNAADIESLRSQFRAMVSSRHTPSTMPSAARLLAMEESWLDPGSRGALGQTPAQVNDGASPTALVSDDDDSPSRALDDLLLGVLAGFFWPLGCAAWALREDGVWSRRRQVAVLVGVAVNFGFGAITALS